MALPVWQATIQTEAGDVVPGAEVQVVVEATGLDAVIFSDRAGTTGITNPFFTGSDGFAQFYAAPGEYRIVATGPSGTRTWRYQVLVGTATDNTWTGDQTFSGDVDVTGQATFDDIEVTGESVGPGEFINGKYIGELIFIDGPAKAPSANFPALCVTNIDDYADIDAANWPDWVSIERAKLAVYNDTGAGGTSSFTGAAAAAVITLDNNATNLAMLAALERHAAAYGDDFASLGVVNDGTDDFEIDDVDAVTREITVDAGAPGAGPYRFYPHRVAGSTTTARIQSWRGRSPVGANGAEGQTVSGYMRRDQTRLITGNIPNGAQWLNRTTLFAGAFTNGATVASDIPGGSTNVHASAVFNSSDSPDMIASATTGEVGATHGPDGGMNFYKHGGRYIAP